MTLYDKSMTLYNKYNLNDNTTLTEEREKLKSLLMKGKAGKAGLKLNIQKLRLWPQVPSLHGR